MIKRYRLIALLCGTFIYCKGFSQQASLSSSPADTSSLLVKGGDSLLQNTPSTAYPAGTTSTDPVTSFFSKIFPKTKKAKAAPLADSVASAPFAFGDFT